MLCCLCTQIYLLSHTVVNSELFCVCDMKTELNVKVQQLTWVCTVIWFKLLSVLFEYEDMTCGRNGDTPHFHTPQSLSSPHGWSGPYSSPAVCRGPSSPSQPYPGTLALYSGLGPLLHPAMTEEGNHTQHTHTSVLAEVGVSLSLSVCHVTKWYYTVHLY